MIPQRVVSFRRNPFDIQGNLIQQKRFFQNDNSILRLYLQTGVLMRKVSLWVVVIGVMMLAGCAKKMTEEQLYAEAQKFEQQQDADKLIKVYEELVDRFPKSQKADEALYKLALVYQNNKQDFPKAIACHERLMKNYPHSKFVSQAHFMSAFIYANDLRDFEKARAAYNSFIEAYPQHELVPSVKWELEHLGQDISQIDLFSNASAQPQEKPAGQGNGATKAQTAKTQAAKKATKP
jgi:tetratricopeptide (TPR) repeat protein